MRIWLHHVHYMFTTCSSACSSAFQIHRISKEKLRISRAGQILGAGPERWGRFKMVQAAKSLQNSTFAKYKSWKVSFRRVNVSKKTAKTAKNGQKRPSRGNPCFFVKFCGSSRKSAKIRRKAAIASAAREFLDFSKNRPQPRQSWLFLRNFADFVGQASRKSAKVCVRMLIAPLNADF